jgi:hypothetical protein
MITTQLQALVVAAAMDADEAAEQVRPGWIPFLIVLALGAFVAFLYFSMRKQLNKIDIPEGGVPTRREDDSEPPPAK